MINWIKATTRWLVVLLIGMVVGVGLARVSWPDSSEEGQARRPVVICAEMPAEDGRPPLLLRWWSPEPGTVDGVRGHWPAESDQPQAAEDDAT